MATAAEMQALAQVDEAGLKLMTPEQIIEAQERGHLDTLLGRTPKAAP
ncbi:hypothetical protein [Arthrobacter dokdonensis]|nr:hypothetical protein [Arthrobacter dokdonellae]